VRVLLERFGDAALRARLPEGADTRSLLEELRALPHVVDAVVTERHALIAFDPGLPPVDVADAIARALSEPSPATAPSEHRIHVRYDGEDLDEVAATTRLSRGDVIALHTAPEYVVAALGFMPGFAYLRGIDSRLVVPRRQRPRSLIEPLSVGVAGPYTGVYPFASPGGWNLVGVAVGFAPFDPRSGATLALGDRVRFVRVAS
jgi:5-oxoprolinase (ATP-hydrolysing) subunit A